MSDELTRDLDGQDAGKAQPDGARAAEPALKMRSDPPDGGERLSKRSKAIIVSIGAALLVLILFGILTAGHPGGSGPGVGAPGPGASEQVGQTRPDTAQWLAREDKMEKAAEVQRARAAAARAARHKSTVSPSGPKPKVSGTHGTGQSVLPPPAENGFGSDSRVNYRQQYQQWLAQRKYKAEESALTAEDRAVDSAIHAGGAQGAAGAGAGGWTSAATPGTNPLAAFLAAQGKMGTGASPLALQKALLAAQGKGESASGANSAWLSSAQRKNPNGYLPSSEEPALGTHELFAGSVIPAVMETGVDSDMPGMVSAVVSQTIYDSLHPDVVLIPQGTRLVGEYSSGIRWGQTRVLVAWNELIMPNGATIALRGMQGGNALGEAGFHDLVNNHYWRLFGSATLLSLLGAGAQVAQPQNQSQLTSPGFSQSATGDLAQELDQVGAQLMQKNLSVAPTLIIRPGYAFNVLVNKTMVLPPYGP